MAADKQTALEREIVAMITAEGHIPVERYMSLCLSHPEHGYYMGRDPFGRGGDFITAPEVSQMFGELFGIWCIAGWQIMEAPDPFNLIELGPGRGTLMADMLRAAGVMPGFSESVHVHMVETSPALKAMQQKTLARVDCDITWHDHLHDVPAGPAIIIANEFFDALPVAQYAKVSGKWHERVVGLEDGNTLKLGLAGEAVADELVPAWARDEADGSICEVSSARALYARAIAERVAEHGGAVLIADYGHLHSSPGDTLQAVRRHKPVDLLHMPGESDITSHVDFETLTDTIAKGGLTTYGPITQGTFLIEMGLREREDVLKRRGNARQRIMISRAAQRLAAGAQMGQLFKVLAATHPGLPKPAPFAQRSEA